MSSYGSAIDPAATPRPESSRPLRAPSDQPATARRNRRRKRPTWQVLAAQVAVLAVALGAISGFALSHRAVVVEVDGQRSVVHGFSTTVGGLLKQQGVELGAHDVVVPAASAAVPARGDIVVRRARQVTVQVDGVERSMWTTAQTVGEVVDDLGLRSTDVATSASRSSRLGSQLRVSTAKPIEVLIGGKVVTGETSAETVGQALTDLGVTLSDGDRTSLPLGSPVAAGLAVVVDKPTYVTVTEDKIFKHETVKKKDDSLLKGTKKVTQQGIDGKQTITYRITKIGGQQVGKEMLTSVVSVEAKDEIVAIGTKKAEAAKSIPAAPAVPSGTAQQIAAKMVKAKGWDESQFSCLVSLWNRESGWRTNAANPSGAYGIPQSLPGSKMAAYGSDWRTNPATQIAWGLAYIKGRYGTPCGAWGAFQSKGWY